MHDLFRFLALAVALGLATGMVLGGIALLLAAPAYGTEAGLAHEPARPIRTSGALPR